ncbi:UNVERIFIED_CONTAM: hypothetical protein PYX00_000902 [Menopon gallinae]|uniref:Vesicle transport protein USE1 n=1 Tax=Menopon gallinae TaxID=328185 RepID=A0AAW2IBZ7_9NEOP
MMEKSVLEINIIRLLKKCEELGKESAKNFNWKLERYVTAVNTMLSELQKKQNKPDAETLNEYIRRTDFLEKLVESQKIENPVQRIVAIQMMSHGTSTPDGVITRELHQKTASVYSADVRKELFGLDRGDELRLRKNDKSSGEDLDSLLRYQQSMREKVAEEMLIMARSLKEQSQLAGSIIKSDIQTIQKSTSIAEKNFSKLKLESARLEEHNKRACKCWLWTLMLIVIVIFINMVFFIRFT